MTPSDRRWLAAILALTSAFVFIDSDCEQDDIDHDRTHLDGTTLSCSLRRFALTTTGRIVLPLVLVVLPAWLARHIYRHLDSQKADW